MFGRWKLKLVRSVPTDMSLNQHIDLQHHLIWTLQNVAEDFLDNTFWKTLQLYWWIWQIIFQEKNKWQLTDNKARNSTSKDVIVFFSISTDI